MRTNVRQRDMTDCGAACLASIGAHYKLEMPVSRIRQIASTDQKGTNVLGMIEAAEKMGFSAKGVRGEFSSLYKIPLPAIAHVVLKEVLHHYVVIYKITKKHVEVMDPADGKLHRYSTEEFKALWSGVLILLAPTDEFEERKESVSVFQRFWFLIKPHKAVMTQALVGAGFYTIIGLSTSIYIQQIVDHVLVDGNMNLLNLLSVVMLVLLGVQVVIGVFRAIFTFKTGQKIDARLVLGYYKHLLKLPQSFFDTMRVGEIISRIGDAGKIRSFINDVAIDLAVNVFVIISAFALMFTYYWKLAVVVLLIIPLYMIIYWISNALNKKVERRLMENAAELESQLVESLNSVRTIKQFNLEEHANLKTEVRFISMLKTIYTSGLNSLFSGTSTEVATRIFTILLLWIGGAYALQNQITPGELLSFYALLGYFTGPAGSLIDANKSIQNALIAGDRLFEIMDLEKEETDELINLEKEMLGDIRFENVGFRYGSRVNVFDDLSLRFQKGKMTAIVGQSGSGKSTLISALMGLYPLQQGSIYVGDINLEHINIASLRKIIGVVPQTIDLFSGNVIDNIAVGEMQPNMLRITDLCERLGLTEFIGGLPNGFKTHLGENGATLSGGQKQRIAIARALYHNPEILVLDEATSNLDSGAEKYVQRAIELFKKECKTVILIAHRLSTVVSADKIVVLENGQLMEEGSHHELIRKEASYYNMWKQQFPAIPEFNDLMETIEA